MTRASVLGCTLFAVACGSNHASNLPDASGTGSDGAVVDGTPTTWPAMATIPLKTPDGSFWGPEVHVGDQTFFMDLDTGSTTIGVAGATCTSCASVGVSPLYLPGTAGIDQHKTASTQYADGSGWGGEIFQASLGLGYGTPNVALDIVSMTSQSQFFTDNSYQGILGLGAPQNAEPSTGAYFDTATTDGAVPIMAFELCDTSGTMWIGGFDAAKASAAPAYTPLYAINANNPFYAIDIDSMSIGTTSVGTGAATFQAPVVDTGTTLFYVPTGVETKILAAVNASTGFKALFGTQALADNGCVTATGVTAAQVDAQLPTMTMTMPPVAGGTAVSLTVKPMLSYLYDGGNGQFCLAVGDGGTQGGTTMGDAIMHAFVTVIDLEHHQVGFAPDTGCGGAPRRPIARATFHPHHPPRPHRGH